jgi:hypothetical protein
LGSGIEAPLQQAEAKASDEKRAYGHQEQFVCARLVCALTKGLKGCLLTPPVVSNRSAAFETTLVRNLISSRQRSDWLT